MGQTTVCQRIGSVQHPGQRHHEKRKMEGVAPANEEGHKAEGAQRHRCTLPFPPPSHEQGKACSCHEHNPGPFQERRWACSLRLRKIPEHNQQVCTRYNQTAQPRSPVKDK
jgi:hypothetical protein